MKNKTLLVVILILISEFVLRYIHYTPNNQQYFFGLDESEIWKVKSDVLTLDKKGRNFFKIENVKLVGNEKVRILSIGDSVTWGDGRQKNNEAIINYTDYLNQIFSDSNIEILNFGAKTFASTRILKIVTEILKLHPQLVILQFGHSEFLENNTIKKYTISKSRSHLMLFSLLIDTIANLVFYFKHNRPFSMTTRDQNHRAPFISEDEVYSRNEVLQVEKNQIDRVREILEILNKNKVYSLWVIPSGNIYFPPFAPYYKNEINNVLNQAITYYKKGIRSHGNKFLLSLAQDYDGFPLRVSSRVKTQLKALIQNSAYSSFVDFDQYLYEKINSPNDAEKYFVDQCHLTSQGHLLLANYLSAKIREILPSLK